MKYSDYNLNQILENRNYKKICECFFKLSKNEETAQILENILYDGGIKDYSIRSNIRSKDNPNLEGIRRISMAYLYLNNPDTFSFFVKNNINIFHGTNGNALLGILENGLNTADDLETSIKNVTTGEVWSRKGGRDFISFTDILEIAEGYSSIASQGGDKKLDFNVVIGTSATELSKVNTVPIHSDISEIGVKKNFPVEYIKCICVPDEKVDFVKRIVHNHQIPVLGLSRLEDKFYCMNDYNYLEFEDFYFENYKNAKEEKTKFAIDEVKEVTITRKKSGIEKVKEKLKNIFQPKKEDSHGRRI